MDLIEYAVYGEVHRYDYETKVAVKYLHNFDKCQRIAGALFSARAQDRVQSDPI